MIFKFSDELIIDTSKEPWKTEGLRVGFFAGPGKGKSFTTGIIVEKFLDQGGTVVIFEPRAEWHTLKQKYPVQVVGGPFLQDVPLVTSEPNLYADVVVKQGVSLVIYTGDVEDEEQLVEFAMRFIRRLLRLQEEYHRPLLLVLEETETYAPFSAKGHIAPPWVYNRMIKAFTECFAQGRKLNVCPIALSQRPQSVSFPIRQLCNLVFFGGVSAQDAAYIDKEVFKPYREDGINISIQNVMDLPTGRWVVIAAKRTQSIEITEKRVTPHGADTPTLEYVAPVGEEISKAVSALGEQLKAMLEKRAAEESELEKAKRTITDLRKQNEELQGKVNLASDLRSLFQGQGDEELRKNLLKAETELNALHKTLDERGEQLKQVLEANDKLTETNQKLQEQVSRFTAFEELLRVIVAPMVGTGKIDEKAVEEIVDRKILKMSVTQRREVAAKTTGIPWIDAFMDKLSPMQQKIIKYLAAKHPLSLTKSDIALGTGYAVSGGSFNSSLSKLVKWKLVVKTGDTYKIAEAPP